MSIEYIATFKLPGKYNTASTMLLWPCPIHSTPLPFILITMIIRFHSNWRPFWECTTLSPILCETSVLCSCSFCGIVYIYMSVWEREHTPDLINKIVLREFKQAVQIWLLKKKRKKKFFKERARKAIITKDGGRDQKWCQKAECEEVQRSCRKRGGKEHQLNNSD